MCLSYKQNPYLKSCVWTVRKCLLVCIIGRQQGTQKYPPHLASSWGNIGIFLEPKSWNFCFPQKQHSKWWLELGPVILKVKQASAGWSWSFSQENTWLPKSQHTRSSVRQSTSALDENTSWTPNPRLFLVWRDKYYPSKQRWAFLKWQPLLPTIPMVSFQFMFVFFDPRPWLCKCNSKQ